MDSAPVASATPAGRGRGGKWTKGCGVVALVLIVVGGYSVWRVAEWMAPAYVREAVIDRVCWGKDGDLYLDVLWGIHQPFIAGERPVWHQGGVIYRVDPRVRKVIRLDEADGERVKERWACGLVPPVKDAKEQRSGWVGARYAAVYPMVNWTNMARFEVGPPFLRDWQTGETTPLPADTSSTVLLSPNDDYALIGGAKGGPVVIYRIPSGETMVVPETVARWPVYATAQGILDPQRKVVVDPTTWETRVGWDPIAGFGRPPSIGPDGRSYVQTGPPGGGPIALWFAKGLWSFPSEMATWRVPDEWKDIRQYRKEYPVQ